MKVGANQQLVHLPEEAPDGLGLPAADRRVELVLPSPPPGTPLPPPLVQQDQPVLRGGQEGRDEEDVEGVDHAEIHPCVGERLGGGSGGDAGGSSSSRGGGGGGTPPTAPLPPPLLHRLP